LEVVTLVVTTVCIDAKICLIMSNLIMLLHSSISTTLCSVMHYAEVSFDIYFNSRREGEEGKEQAVMQSPVSMATAKSALFVRASLSLLEMQATSCSRRAQG